MFSCKVLIGPIATDKEYHTGDTVCLDKKDADTLSGFGLVEIIGEVEPKFVSQVVPTPVVEPAVAQVVEPIVETSAPVVETTPVAETPAPVIEPAPVIDAVLAIESTIVEPTVAETLVEAPIDETAIIGDEDTLSLEEVSAGTSGKRKK